ncbi:MAG: methylenetetrahydrofolate reductase [Dehalococcoidia bacterium]
MDFWGPSGPGQLAVALEITPPQRSLPHVLVRRAALLGRLAGAVDVIQRPGRQSSLEAAAELAAAGFAPIWHLVTHGRTRDQVEAEVLRAAALGLHDLLALKGDHDSEGPGLPIREAVAIARDLLPGARLGATLNQYARDTGAARRNLFGKLAAGATYVETQPVFAHADVRPSAEAVKERFPGARVVAMVMPLPSADAGRKLAARLGIPEPAGPPFEELIAELAASPLIDGIAVMTFEMDPGPEAGERIAGALAAAGVATDAASG